MPRVQPVVDRQAAKLVGESLRALGFGTEAIVSLLGEDAFTSEGEAPVVAARRLPTTPVATAIEALFLQLPVSTRDATRALGRATLDALERIGLAEIGAEFVPLVRILPVDDLLVASDDFPADDEESPPDYVAAYTPTSRLCDLLTPRRRVARALDVGTGSGVQALRAARHAQRVVATDVNDRALAYTALNAALNGLDNVECRRGSLFEPVRGERFDLITCNAPYVVSPETRWVYRDSGLPTDELSERIVRGAAELLADGGYATLLVSWVAADADEPDERPLEWTDGIGCDSWILPVWEADPLAHAATWNEHLTDDPDELEDALDSWTEYLEDLGVGWVSEGAVVLHRRAAAEHTSRVDLIDDDVLEPAGEQVQRAFAARARLQRLRNDDELLEARLALTMPLRLETEVDPARGVVGSGVELVEGTASSVDGSREAIDVVTRLEAGKPLRAAMPNADAKLRREVLAVVRELLELGALRFA